MSEPCHRGCTCGCCAGVEVLTPAAIANRPGLDALAYRVGTHATFFETLQARLSSQDHTALAGLTTRAADDFSLALLDAWATAADVLTFYQERLANEGYLRTATERRSVLELARLVGYAPRPGVAASTWLAFTLDAGPEVVIPAGARAQSVPGPGELPQPFETGEALTARAAWNLLPVRQTRPQLADEVIKDGALYLKGIATRLRPNDPLLIKTVAAETAKPVLYRVMAVEPDAQADRTRVIVRAWVESSNTAADVATTAGAGAAAALQSALDRVRDLEAFGVSPESLTARRVLSHLEPLASGLASGAAEPTLRQTVEEQLLPRLETEHETARAGGFRRLEPWIGAARSLLEEGLGAEPAEPSRSAERPVFSQLGAASPALTGTLPDVLDRLGRSPSVPPRSSARLERDVAQVFASGSDVTTQILLAARPELRDVLYTAWAHVPATAPSVLAVWAPRQKARVFGHNAPLELVRGSTGVILGSKEWELDRAQAQAGGKFRIGLRLLSNQGGLAVVAAGAGDPVLRISITLDRASGGLDLADFAERRDVPIAVGPETVFFTLETPERPRFLFSCPPRGLSVALFAPPNEGGWEVTTEGADPDTVTVLADPRSGHDHIAVQGRGRTAVGIEKETVVYLDNSYPQILPGSWIVLERPSDLDGGPVVTATAAQVSEQSRAAYGITGPSTWVELNSRWLRLQRETIGAQTFPADTFAVIRGTAVYAQSELLELAEMPIVGALCGGRIELAGLQEGLKPGRWLIVSGERTDVVLEKMSFASEAPKETQVVPGIPAAELVMVAGVEQGFAKDLAGERTHTTLTLAAPLAYCYRRDTVKVWGNVAPATHGETKAEVLGSGDASQPRQRFALKQAPLTYVSAPTPSGIASTLQVRVNDLLWHEAESVFGLTPTDRAYTTRRSDEEVTTVVFGDGRRGARPPSGSENLRAVYRVGLGRQGNLDAGRISQLVTRPLGVKDVVNPLPATGGADAESRDRARANAPLAVMALDRLVGVEDYADFARTFAGIGRAHAVRLSNGRTQLVHVTIAGEDDIPIADTSDLFRNLAAALRQFGDPHLPVQLAVRDARLLAFAAGVRLLPDFAWEAVAPKIRAALLAALGFDRRDLAQDAVLSEALRAAQSVAGVDFVDVDLFDTVTGTLDPTELKKQLTRLTQDQPKARLRARPARVEGTGANRTIRPAELLYLSPAVPDTVLLKELPA